LPVPLAPAVTSIHPAFDIAVQLQPTGAVTATDAAPPCLSKSREDGLIE
jgi:hypothetical protein